MQKSLDLSIKKHDIGTMDGAYGSYQSYMNEEMWGDFICDMKDNHPSAFVEYGAGSGGELTPKGKFPPKMASYGSSSRMIYNLSKGVQDFYFEYKLPTAIGGTANIDGYLERANKHIFIEAKCREPYGVKSHLIAEKYKELYEYISNDVGNNLSIDFTVEKTKINVDFFVDGVPMCCFDIKQMICHLLGIATKFLSYPTRKPVSFLYLCYNPTLIEIADEDKKTKIISVYERMCRECTAIDFKSLFNTIVRFLHEEKRIGYATVYDVDKLISNFEFTLCDQENYISLLTK